MNGAEIFTNNEYVTDTNTNISSNLKTQNKQKKHVGDNSQK